MRYIALATDYDGTLAHDGVVGEETIQALERFRQSGRKLILVTGRELDDLMSVFPRCDLFERIVAENGAVLYTPQTRETQVLAEPPSPALLAKLRERGVPLGVGSVIVATCRPYETGVLEVIRDLGLELHVIFNKSSVMILPATVNKATGLKAALESLKISEHNVAAIGDAENDHAFLKWCEFSAAVANALPALKDAADLTTSHPDGAGVAELIAMILSGDLASRPPARRAIEIGRDGAAPVTIPAYGSSVLIAGGSGSGKSNFTTALIECLIERKYQVCLIDPEGDYEGFEGAITIGDEKHPPSLHQVMQALEKPSEQVIVNFLGVPLPDRASSFAGLAPRIEEMRLRTARPHWIVIDEAHHMLPPEWSPESAQATGELDNVVLITVHPGHLSPRAMQAVNVMIAVGEQPARLIQDFAAKTGIRTPPAPAGSLPQGEALIWFRDANTLRRVKLIESKSAHTRHVRKYAHGELGEDHSFYFRGPAGKLNLRAQNLAIFLQLAQGVDDATWLYHLQCGDYSRWFRDKIKDDDLAREAAQAERIQDAKISREKIRDAIERRYTAPA